MSKDAKFAGWYTRAITAKKLGISLSTLLRRVEEGTYYSEPDGEGIWWFNPKEIDALVPEAASEGSAAVISATAQALKQAQDHNEVLLRVATEPSQMALKLLMRANERLEGENKVLRERETEYLKAREQMISEAHERELASRIVDAREKRYEEGFKLLITYAPKLIEQASGMKDLKPLIEVLDGLDDAMIDMLVPSFLTEDQAKKIKTFKAKNGKKKPPVETTGEEVKPREESIPVEVTQDANDEGTA